jgi:hypothetical protein
MLSRGTLRVTPSLGVREMHLAYATVRSSMRVAWPLLLVALRAAAQDPPPPPHWEIEVDAAEDFDDLQRTDAGTVHTHHFAHFTVVLDTESVLPIDGQLRIATPHARVISFAGRITGGREAITKSTEAIADYSATLLPEKVSLSLAYDGPGTWAGTFALPVLARGTNTACVVHTAGKTCAGAEIAPLAPFGWAFDSRRGGGKMTRDGDTWIFHYAHDAGRGELRYHRELTLRMRPTAVASSAPAVAATAP